MRWKNKNVTKLLFVAVIWSPTFLALAFIARNQAARSGVHWRLGKVQYLPVGIAVETVIAFEVLALISTAGPATSGWFTFFTDGVTIARGPWVLGTGRQGWAPFILNIGATAIAYSSIGLSATVGKEFAWRGFLQVQFERRVGVVQGILAVAAIWWAWHLPGLPAGYNSRKPRCWARFSFYRFKSEILT